MPMRSVRKHRLIGSRPAHLRRTAVDQRYTRVLGRSVGRLKGGPAAEDCILLCSVSLSTGIVCFLGGFSSHQRTTLHRHRVIERGGMWEDDGREGADYWDGCGRFLGGIWEDNGRDVRG